MKKTSRTRQDTNALIYLLLIFECAQAEWKAGEPIVDFVVEIPEATRCSHWQKKGAWVRKTVGKGQPLGQTGVNKDTL